MRSVGSVKKTVGHRQVKMKSDLCTSFSAALGGGGGGGVYGGGESLEESAISRLSR